MPPTTVASRRLTAWRRGRARRSPAGRVRGWARGPARAAAGSARRPAVRASSARPKASVLPEPVRPRPSMSRPASEFGSVAAWIGNGSVTPWAARVFSSAVGHVQLVERLDGGQRGGDGLRQREFLGGAARRDALPEPTVPEPDLDRALRVGGPGVERVMRNCPPGQDRNSTSRGPHLTVRTPAANTRPAIRRGRCSPPAGPSGPA